MMQKMDYRAVEGKRDVARRNRAGRRRKQSQEAVEASKRSGLI